MEATTLTAAELADRIENQMAYYRLLFKAANTDTMTGAITVHDALKPIAADLRAGRIAPVVAQVRLIGARRTAARYTLSFDVSTRA